jgi:hypothetical protein
LEIGSSWSDRILRLQKEREYIQKYQSNCYNQMLPKSNVNLKITNSKMATQTNSIPIKINNQNFVSKVKLQDFFKLVFQQFI